MKYVFRFVLVLAVLLAGLGIAPQVVLGSPSWQGAQPTPWAQIFLPFLNRPAPDSVTGRVIEVNGKPVRDVTVVDNFGNTATTDANGYYKLPLKDQTGELVLSAEKQNYYFTPSMVTVDPQRNSQAETILAVAACNEMVSNGSFADDTYWVYPETPVRAGRVTNAGHTDSNSARTGILSGKNRESYSSVRSQVINIPASIDSATLRLWLYPIAAPMPATSTTLPHLAVGVPADSFLGETPAATAAGDVHYVVLLDQNNNVIDYLFTGLRNDQQWTLFEFDLSRFAGRQVKIHAGTYNDGLDGLAAMYVDDISFEVCSSGSTPTTPGGGTGACTNYFGNSSFETNGSWNIPITEYSAAFSTDVAQDGVRSMRTGITNPAHNRFSYSDAYQSVFVPATATSVSLTMYIYPQSTGATAQSLGEPQRPRMDVEFGTEALADDAQYVLLLDSQGFIVDYLFWTHSNSRTWTPLTFDLTAYRGRTLRIQFGTFNNGTAGATSMYVDNAVLNVCTGTPGPTATPTTTAVPTNTPLPPTATPPPTPVIPTPTAQPGVCSELISNNGFEQTSAWTIPLTVFSAGYSNRQAHTGVQSMRTGIVFTAHDRFSYSDFRQTVTIPSTASTATLNFWLYPESEEVEADASSAMMESPTAELNAAAAQGRDVQYVLILDRNGYWIDTLLWMRSNEQTWINKQIDLSDYIGETISIQFGTFNDGPQGGVKRVTSMFVDDVSLLACP